MNLEYRPYEGIRFNNLEPDNFSKPDESAGEATGMADSQKVLDTEAVADNVTKYSKPTPFRDPLEKTDYKPGTVEIKKLESHPGKLVRELLDIRVNRSNLGEYLKKFKSGKQLFKKLHKDYGINVVDMDTIAGVDESGVLKIYTIVDKIEGENIKDIATIPLQAQQELAAYYLGIVEHYIDTFTSGGDYWSDPSNGQIMYGNKYGQEGFHIYIVDVDPIIFYYDKNEKIDDPIIFDRLRDLALNIVQAEKKFKPVPIKLLEVRKKLLDFVEDALKNYENSGVLKKIKEYLTF